MKILFRNIGSIKALDFELKKGLTLFCGKNGTGKTYAAYAIFSILNGIRKLRTNWLNAQDFETLLAQGSLLLDLKKISESADFLNDISKTLAENLSADFDAPVGFFGKDCIRINGIPFQLLDEEAARSTETWFNILGDTLTFELMTDKIGISLLKASTADGNPAISDAELKRLLNLPIFNFVANQYLGRVQVLTAERAAINLFSRELSSYRVDMVDQLLGMGNSGGDIKEFDMLKFVQQKATRYSLPIRKGLEVAEDLKNISKKKGEFAVYADKLEELILGGKIQIGENGELVYIHTEASSLRINLAASMVKSLASLVVYLRHQAAKGDLLIIDEPELNLHPESQRKVARFLCELTNAGLNILISTHSDYIVREVNNAILLKHPSMQNVKTRHGYLDEQLIAPDRVSVVLFNDSGYPEQLTVDEKGFAVDSIDNEIDLLNQIADDIEQEWQE